MRQWRFMQFLEGPAIALVGLGLHAALGRRDGCRAVCRSCIRMGLVARACRCRFSWPIVPWANGKRGQWGSVGPGTLTCARSPIRAALYLRSGHDAATGTASA